MESALIQLGGTFVLSLQRAKTYLISLIQNTAGIVIGAISVALIAVITTLLLTHQIMLPEVSSWTSFSYSLPSFNLGNWSAPFVRTLTETNTRTITAFQPTTTSEPSGPFLTTMMPLVRYSDALTTTTATQNTQDKSTVHRSLRTPS